MSITVRHAAVEDIEALIDLYREFHEFHVKGVPDRLKIPSFYDNKALRSKLEDILAAKDSAVVVAESDGQIVGLAEVYVREDEVNPYRVPYRYAHLQSMMVSETYRKRGIGKRLLRAAEQWARERDVAEMRLDVWEFEAGPLKFYENHGYRTHRRTMVQKL
jgi:GNAT superfamily N-acetyltransferase